MSLSDCRLSPDPIIRCGDVAKEVLIPENVHKAVIRIIGSNGAIKTISIKVSFIKREDIAVLISRASKLRSVIRH